MSDSKTGKDFAIHLKIDGVTRYVKGATKYTTFGDVIKMVLKKNGIGKEYRHLFSIVEATQDDEEPMCNKDRILKIVKARPDDTVIFALKKMDTVEQPPVSAKTAPEADKQTQTKIKKNTKKKTTKTTHTVNHVGSGDVRVKKNIMHVNSKTHKKACIKYSGGDELIKRRAIETGELFTTQCDTNTSDSDEEIEEIISNLDQSKVSAFIKIFNSLLATDSKKRSKSPVENSSIHSRRLHQKYAKRRSDRKCNKEDRLYTSTQEPSFNNSPAIRKRNIGSETPNISCPLDVRYPLKSERDNENEAPHTHKKHVPTTLSVKRYFSKKRSFDISAGEKKKTRVQRELTSERHVSGADRTQITSSTNVNRSSKSHRRRSIPAERYTQFKMNRGFGATFVVKDEESYNDAFTASPCPSYKLVDYSLSEDENSDEAINTCTNQLPVHSQDATRLSYSGCLDRMEKPNTNNIKSIERSNIDSLDKTELCQNGCGKRNEQPRIAYLHSLEKAHIDSKDIVEQPNNECTYVTETSQTGWLEGSLSNDSSGLDTGNDSGEYASILEKNCSDADGPCVDTTAELIMTVFGSQCSLGEDEEMDSFMLSKTYDEDDDLLDEGYIDSEQSDCT